MSSKKKRPSARRSPATKRHTSHARKPEHFAPGVKPQRVSWIAGARLRTLPLAIAPVAIGAGAAAMFDMFSWVLSILCLVVALALQIGVNFANDYSDGVRGTDQSRVGPGRLTGSGSASPRSVLTVALVFFGIAAAAGIAITVLTQIWWLPVAGAVCLVAAWFYTGGKRPYGYIGLGEVAVFLFFGLVATVGTTFVQATSVNLEAWVGGAGIGFLATAVLVINNARDIETDRRAGKRTLATRMGRRGSVILFVVLIVMAMAAVSVLSVFYTNGWYLQFLWLIALPACLIALTSKSAAEDILVLRLTTLMALIYGLGLGAVLTF